jgi:hypothetical protein
MSMTPLRLAISSPLAVLWVIFAVPAHAQITHADLCRTESMGLTMTMKTAVGLQQPRAVALEQAGLKIGGLRHTLASLAHRRLEAGVKESTVVEEVRAACLRADYRALLDDKPTFNTVDAGGAGAQLCSDIGTSMAGFLADDSQAATLSVEDALLSYAPREHSDNPMPRPRLSAAMQLTQQFARTNRDAKKIADFAMRHCNSLDARAKAELDREYYAE